MALLEKLNKLTAQNIFLDDNTGGKGRYFKSRFLQPGLVKYSFGVCVLENDTIKKFIQGFVGCPVIINHKDVTNENAKDERVGVISRVWFDENDGWFWGEGVIFDEEALSLIESGYNVSCQYEITEYSNNTKNELHNGNPYDKVILNGKPEHLAIVKTPRYENAMIAVNAIDLTDGTMEAENGFITIDGGTENERVVWIPENVHWVKPSERRRVLDVCDNYKEGDETKFDFSHTRIKPSESQVTYLKNTLKSIESAYNFKKVAQIEISSSLNSGSFGVCFAPNNTSFISLAPSIYKENGQAKFEKSVESGFHPKGTGDAIKSVLVHEIGHSITCNSMDEKFWSKVDTIRKEYLKTISKDDIDHPDFISNYARENKYEFVAEAFCQGTLSKKYGKYTKQIMDLMNEHFSKNKQMKLAVNKEDDGEMWVEGFGFGYPIDEESYEEYKDEQQKEMKKDTAKNTIIEAINELKENNMFNKLFKKKEKQMDKDELKSLFMDCIQDVLRAQNEAEDEDIDEKDAENEEDEKEEKAENRKACNEDKRKLIDEVAGMMKSAGCDDEVIRTAIAKMEKIGYEKSEAGTADNCGKKGKNEEVEVEEKEEKEEVANKAKNSIEALKGLLSSGEVSKPASKYMTKSQAIELGNQLF